MRFFIFAFLTIFQGATAQEHIQAQNTEELVASPVVVERVASFIKEFIDPAKSPQEQAALFTDNAEYYDQGSVGGKAIVRDAERYARRWPFRDYRLSAIHYIKPDPESDRIFVSYEITYKVANSSKTVKGKAYYGAVIDDLMQAPKIEWIKEQVQPGH